MGIATATKKKKDSDTMLRFFHRKPDFIIGSRTNPYLLRWFIIPQNRFFNIYLHKFLRSDDDRALHDHPWVSLGIILKGAYFEHIMNRGTKLRFTGDFIFRRATHAHRVELIAGRPVWTLFITGPKIREWGFYCPQGWRHWRDFIGVPFGEAKGDEVGKGCL